MKKVIAILLSAMMIISSAVIAVNAEEIKDVFGVNEQSKAVESLSDVGSTNESRGDGEFFNLQKATYTSTFARIGNKTLDGYNNKVTTYGTGYVNKYSQKPADYNLTTQFTIKASASATNGELIIPLDNLYVVTNSLSGSSAPYFKDFTYKVGDGATQNAIIQTGPVHGIEDTNKYLSLPLVSPDTAETNLNVYLNCMFEFDHVSFVKRGAVFFEKYYTVANGSVDGELEAALMSDHKGYFYSSPSINLDQITEDRIFRGVETQTGFNTHSAYATVGDFSKHMEIPLDDSVEHPVVSTITISPGVKLELTTDQDKLQVTGDINTGYTIVSYVTRPGDIYVGRNFSTGNATFDSYEITVPATSEITEVVIEETIIAHTKDGDETKTITRTVEVIPPIQNLNDDAFGMEYNQIFLNLNEPNFKQEYLSLIKSLSNQGILPIEGVSYTWENDSDLPASMSDVAFSWGSLYKANVEVTARSSSGSRTIKLDNVADGKTYTVGYDSNSEIKLNNGEWIEKITSIPVYTDTDGVHYGIKGEDNDRNILSPIAINFISKDGKNPKTGADIQHMEESVFKNTLKYMADYKFNGVQQDRDTVDKAIYDENGVGTITASNKLVYTRPYISHTAYMQVIDKTKQKVAAQSGTETTDIDVTLSIRNAAFGKDRLAYQAMFEDYSWVNPVVTFELPIGVKFNTSNDKLTQNTPTKYTMITPGDVTSQYPDKDKNYSSAYYKYTETDVEVVFERLPDTADGREVWKSTTYTKVERSDGSTYSFAANVPTVFNAVVPIPLTLTSDALGGLQYANLYTSSAPTQDNFICNSSKPIISTVINNSKLTSAVVTDENDYDADGSTADNISEFANVAMFSVNDSYEVNVKTEYKDSKGNFRDASNGAIPTNIGGINEYRTIIRNDGNVNITKIVVKDVFPTFDGEKSTYVDDSMYVQILDKEGKVVENVNDFTTEGSTTMTLTLPNVVLLPGYSLRTTAQFLVSKDAPVGVTADNNIDISSYFAGSEKTTKVIQPYITQGWGEEPDLGNTYTLVFLNDQLNSGSVYYQILEGVAGPTYTLTEAPITQVYGENASLVKDGVPFYETLLFAGWFKTKDASQYGDRGNHHVDPTQAFAKEITLADCDVVESVTIDSKEYTNVIYLYSGFVREDSVTKNTADNNDYGTSTLPGFSLEGVQIRNHKWVDPYDDNGVHNTINDALRFVTIYNNSMLDELQSLYNSKVDYGYAACAAKFISEDEELTLTSNTHVKDEVCTKAVNEKNHKYFDDYRISTFVITYDNSADQQYLDQYVEARAYVKYVDANGFNRVGYNTYSNTKYAGGCRTSYNDTLTAYNNMNVVKPQQA